MMAGLEDEEINWLSRKLCLILLLFFTMTSTVECSCFSQNVNDSIPRFTELPQNKLHVSHLGFRNMRCPVENYCRILWYKQSNKIRFGDYSLEQNHSDFGDPYPWDLGTDTEISLEDDNKTLRFQSAGADARGYYTCVVSNGEYNIARTTRLQVNGISVKGDPLVIQDDRCFNQTAALGQNITLQCTFYADRSISVSWLRPNTTLPEDQWGTCTDGDWLHRWEFEKLSGYTTYQDKRTSERIADVDTPLKTKFSVTGELHIFSVSEEAYGLYCIQANNFGDWTDVVLMLSPPEELAANNPSSSGPPLIIMASVFTILVLSSLIWKAISLDVKLWYHIHYRVAKEQDGQLYDAYMSYCSTDKDRLFVLNVLMPYFEKHGYKLFIPEIHTVPSNVFLEELRKAMELSRCCIMLITQNYLESEHGKFEVELAGDVMSSKMSECIIPVLLGVSPCCDSSPQSSSDPSVSSASSTQQLSQPSSVPSFSSSSVNYSSSDGTTQKTSFHTTSISNDCLQSTATVSSQRSSSNYVGINFDPCPLLGQLVKVLNPLKIKRKEPFQQCNYNRFLKKLHLRMPKLPSGSRNADAFQKTVAVPQTNNAFVKNEEMLKNDENWNESGIGMVEFPKVYPMIPNAD